MKFSSITEDMISLVVERPIYFETAICHRNPFICIIFSFATYQGLSIHMSGSFYVLYHPVHTIEKLLPDTLALAEIETDSADGEGHEQYCTSTLMCRVTQTM